MKPEDIQDLKQLIDFLKENQVAEFDLDRGDLKIRLKFQQPPSAAFALPDLGRITAAAPQSAAAPAVVSAPQPPAPGPVQDDAGLHIIKSPIVGTFYGAPTPGAAPFASPGDKVAKGQVLGIIEAMKLMNEIESDVAGEFVESFVSDGQPIEYGQPLFSIRTA